MAFRPEHASPVESKEVEEKVRAMLGVGLKIGCKGLATLVKLAALAKAR